jgi:EmrB/QacA subfamily drug resistance transporter
MNKKKPKKKPAENGLILFLLSMAQFMVVLDFSIVNVAITTIQKDLHFTQANLQWIITAYALTFGGLLLLAGKLTDLYGRKKILIIGLILFSLVSLIGGLSQSQLMLISSRAIQGIGAALIMPAAMSIITTIFTEQKERQHALSILGAVGSSGFAAGVLFGGILTATLGWRYVFFINVPIGILVAIMIYKVIPQTKNTLTKPKLDIAGALTSTGGLAAFIYAVTTGGDRSWTSTDVLITGGIAVVLIASFIEIELQSKNPLIPFSIFKLPSLRGANIITFFWFGAFAAMFLLLTQYLQDILHYSVLITGLMFLPMGMVMFIMSSYLASKLMDKFNVKPVIIAGLSVGAIGFLLLTALPVDGTYWINVFPGMILVALGAGTSFVGLLVASVAGVSSDRQGLASGLINTSRQIGASVCLSILVAIEVAGSHGAQSISPTVFTAGIHDGFIGAFIFVIVSIVASISFIKEKECDIVIKIVGTQRVINKVMCLQ